MAGEGKKFERDFVDSFKGLDGVSVDRFYDIMGLRKNVSNPSDYVAYEYPNQFYFECKSYAKDSIPLSALSHSQKAKLIEKSKIYGVIAGGVFNFRIEEPKTFFVSIQELEILRLNGHNSLTIGEAEKVGVLIPHRLKRTRYWYDIKALLGGLKFDGKVTDT